MAAGQNRCQPSKMVEMRTKKKMNTSLEWTIAKTDAWIGEMKAWQKEMMAYQEVMEVCLESNEPTSVVISVRSGA
jgi:hypothetical protein